MRNDNARAAALAMDAATFRTLGHRLIDQLADCLDAVPRGPVTHAESPSAIRAALDLSGDLPESGCEPGPLLENTTRLLFAHSLFNAHPRFFGYITSPPAPIGILADLVAAAANPNVGSFALAPAATEIESQTVRWIAQLVGYPVDCGGLLVSGGNMANLTCFLAARHARRGIERARVYTSSETHTWIQKAADMSGIGQEAIRWIPADADMRMDVSALRRQLEADTAAGDAPMIVVATAGTVSTGAVDPLGEIAAVCRQHNVWFHVDGAYGGFAAVVPDAPPDLHRLHEADSIAVDPHKWLYAPLEAGCALVRDSNALRSAFAHHPSYYHFQERTTNYSEQGPQNSRGFRALKVWLALRHAGAAGYRRMIADDMGLSKAMAAAVSRHPDLELFTQGLSITTFRYAPRHLRDALPPEDLDRRLDALNRDLLDRLQCEGNLFVSNAVVRGRYVLRACVVNFHTSAADVEAVPEIVVRAARGLDRSA